MRLVQMMAADAQSTKHSKISLLFSNNFYLNSSQHRISPVHAPVLTGVRLSFMMTLPQEPLHPEHGVIIDDKPSHMPSISLDDPYDTEAKQEKSPSVSPVVPHRTSSSRSTILSLAAYFGLNVALTLSNKAVLARVRPSPDSFHSPNLEGEPLTMKNGGRPPTPGSSAPSTPPPRLSAAAAFP